MLRVEALRKRYGAAVAVDGISFVVEPGEVFGLLGPNGAGKTTAIECILGLRRADEGQIEIGGCDALAHRSSVRAMLGAQLQSTALPDKITVREALRLFATFHRSDSRVEEWIDKLGLREKAGARFESLSGGQRQLLGLGLAMISEPRLLVLDEPSAGLDPGMRRTFFELVREARSGGAAVLLSTHHLAEAERLCDRLAVLERGRMLATGRPRDLIDGAALRTSLIFSLDGTLAEPALRGMVGVTEVRRIGEQWSLRTADPNQTLLALTRQALAGGVDLLELEVRRPTLEDYFFHLTGRSWPDEEDPAA